MNKFLPVVSLVALVILQSCSASKFTSSSFEEKTRDHKIIAVVPVKMILTGKQPKDITKEQIKQIEQDESVMFQESLHNKILGKNGHVQLQSVAKTNNLLEKSGIDIRESWKMTAEELAAVLNVDAVVRAKVQKERYISDLASYGLQVAENILGGLLGGTPLGKNSRTSTISGTCEVLDADDSEVLWNVSVQDDIDWNTSANETVERFNSKFARNFPYKK